MLKTDQGIKYLLFISPSINNQPELLMHAITDGDIIKKWLLALTDINVPLSLFPRMIISQVPGRSPSRSPLEDLTGLQGYALSPARCKQAQAAPLWSH